MNIKELISNDSNSSNLDLTSFIKLNNFRGIHYSMLCNLDDHIESQIVQNEAYPVQLIDYFLSTFQSNCNGVVIDVGANIGSFSVPIAKKYSYMQFHCFEPNDTVYQKLKINCALNNLEENIICHKTLIHDASTEIAFYEQTQQENMGLSSTIKNDDINNFVEKFIKPVKIDELFLDTSEIKFLKIDTQGSELNVLNSAKLVIKKNKPIICFELEENYLMGSRELIFDQLINFFEELGYTLFYMNSKLDKLKPKVTLSSAYSFNGDLIAIPFLI